ncbi:MAG: AAA family ATPase [Spirochaetaceae bacterium]
MRLNKAKDVIKELYKTHSVTALISERGVGKTSIYKQCTEEMGIGYIDLYAAALEGPDFMGLPDKNRTDEVTTYLPPRFLPTIQSVKSGIHPTSGILVLEEINRVSPDTVSVLYPLLLERKLNDHILADGWRIAVTMNPDNMNYMVNTLDDAIIDRFIAIWIEPNIDDYIKYSRLSFSNNKVLSYLKSYPEMLLVVRKNSSALQKSPTPRGWSKIQEILEICNISEDILQETIAGIVGSEAAASFLGFIQLRDKELPDASDILTNYNSVENQIVRLINNNNIDLLNQIIKSTVSKIDVENSMDLTHLNRFLNILPQELQIVFYKELITKDENLLSQISDSMDSFDSISDVIIDLMTN